MRRTRTHPGDPRARTEGWSKTADLDVWRTTPTGPVLVFAEVPLPTVGFTPPPDELCDIMEARLALPPHETCHGLTYTVRVRYEDDCAGCAVFGDDPDRIYDFDEDELRIHLIVHGSADRRNIDLKTVVW